MKNEPADRESIAAWLRRHFVVLPIILHLTITLPLACFLNIWMDEASTLYTTRNGFFHTLNNVFADEKQAPLYFLILSIWRMFGDSIFFARLFSIICGASAIFFFHRLARRFFDEFAANFIVVLFAIHPYLIWASVEIRGYSSVILLSVLLLKLFFEGFSDTDDVSRKSANVQRKAQIYFVATSIIALYTSYYLGFLLVGGFVALLVVRRFQAARNYFLQMLVVGACILPLLWIIWQQFAINTSGFTAEKSIVEGIRILWHHAFTLTFPIEPAPAESSVISIIRIWFIRLTAAAVVFLLIKNKFRAASEKVLMFGTITTVVIAFLLTAYFLLGTGFVAFRHVAVLFVPLVLFLGVLLTDVLPRRYLIIFAVVLALLFPYSKIFKQYPNFAKRGDWARIARFIEQNEKPNQPIIIFQNYDALTLPFHYRGINKILPDENFFAWSAENSYSNENAFADQTTFVISEIPPEANEIWLATEEVCQTAETKAACRPLENFVEANYTVIETKDFYLERLRLLRRK
ncbi:MAG: hypothetical protein ACR2MG_09905 [Pyrinomonadaceae bacterium]